VDNPIFEVTVTPEHLIAGMIQVEHATWDPRMLGPTRIVTAEPLANLFVDYARGKLAPVNPLVDSSPPGAVSSFRGIWVVVDPDCPADQMLFKSGDDIVGRLTVVEPAPDDATCTEQAAEEDTCIGCVLDQVLGDLDAQAADIQKLGDRVNETEGAVNTLASQFRGTVEQIATAVNLQAARLDRLEAQSQSCTLARGIVEELIKTAIARETS
jgi:hypothetical protein